MPPVTNHPADHRASAARFVGMEKKMTQIHFRLEARFPQVPTSVLMSLSWHSGVALLCCEHGGIVASRPDCMMMNILLPVFAVAFVIIHVESPSIVTQLYRPLKARSSTQESVIRGGHQSSGSQLVETEVGFLIYASLKVRYILIWRNDDSQLISVSSLWPRITCVGSTDFPRITLLVPIVKC